MYEAHEAATFSRQPMLSYAASLALAQLVHLSCLDSFSTILLHVVLGHPTLLFPSGCHSITTRQSSFLSFLSTWPIQFHLLLQISFLIFSTPVTWEIVSFRMHCSHQILENQLKSIKFLLFSRQIVNYLTVILVLVSFHASHPYNRTGCTKVLNSLIFVFQPILCVFQIFPKLKIATCALLRCFLISSVSPPSYVTVMPRYTNSSMSSWVAIGLLLSFFPQLLLVFLLHSSTFLAVCVNFFHLYAILVDIFLYVLPCKSVTLFNAEFSFHHFIFKLFCVKSCIDLYSIWGFM